MRGPRERASAGRRSAGRGRLVPQGNRLRRPKQLERRRCIRTRAVPRGIAPRNVLPGAGPPQTACQDPERPSAAASRRVDLGVCGLWFPGKVRTQARPRLRRDERRSPGTQDGSLVSAPTGVSLDRTKPSREVDVLQAPSHLAHRSARAAGALRGIVGGNATPGPCPQTRPAASTSFGPSAPSTRARAAGVPERGKLSRVRQAVAQQHRESLPLGLHRGPPAPRLGMPWPGGSGHGEERRRRPPGET